MPKCKTRRVSQPLHTHLAKAANDADCSTVKPGLALSGKVCQQRPHLDVSHYFQLPGRVLAIWQVVRVQAESSIQLLHLCLSGAHGQGLWLLLGGYIPQNGGDTRQTPVPPPLPAALDTAVEFCNGNLCNDNKQAAQWRANSMSTRLICSVIVSLLQYTITKQCCASWHVC